jgi:hypothetical protein
MAMATFYSRVHIDEPGVRDVNFATHYGYDDGAMSKRKEQAASDWKLTEADESSGCVVDGAV